MDAQDHFYVTLSLHSVENPPFSFCMTRTAGLTVLKLSYVQMAEVVKGKSRGLKFAEQQLLRHGWEQGRIRETLLS